MGCSEHFGRLSVNFVGKNLKRSIATQPRALASEFRIGVAWRARSCVVNNLLRPFGYAQGTRRTPLIANTYPCQPCIDWRHGLQRVGMGCSEHFGRLSVNFVGKNLKRSSATQPRALASEFRIRVAWRVRSCVVNNLLRPFGYAQGTRRTPLIANTYPCQPCIDWRHGLQRVGMGCSEHFGRLSVNFVGKNLKRSSATQPRALASEFRIRVAWRARSCVVNNRLRPFGYAQGTRRTPLIANTYPYQPIKGEGII